MADPWDSYSYSAMDWPGRTLLGGPWAFVFKYRRFIPSWKLANNINLTALPLLQRCLLPELLALSSPPERRTMPRIGLHKL